MYKRLLFVLTLKALKTFETVYFYVKHIYTFVYKTQNFVQFCKNICRIQIANGVHTDTEVAIYAFREIMGKFRWDLVAG